MKEEYPPSSATINSLPPNVRGWIHELETQCDPSGVYRDAAAQKENALALAARVKELESRLPTITGRVSSDKDMLIHHLIAWLQDCYERIPYADTHETYNTYERRLKAAWEALVSLGVEDPGEYL